MESTQDNQPRRIEVNDEKQRLVEVLYERDPYQPPQQHADPPRRMSLKAFVMIPAFVLLMFSLLSTVSSIRPHCHGRHSVAKEEEPSRGMWTQVQQEIHTFVTTSASIRDATSQVRIQADREKRIRNNGRLIRPQRRDAVPTPAQTSSVPSSSSGASSTSKVSAPSSTKGPSSQDDSDRGQDESTSYIVTSSPLDITITRTLPQGGVTELTSVSWVAVSEAVEPTGASQPDLQNAASVPYPKLVLTLASAMLVGFTLI